MRSGEVCENAFYDPTASSTSVEYDDNYQLYYLGNIELVAKAYNETVCIGVDTTTTSDSCVENLIIRSVRAYFNETNRYDSSFGLGRINTDNDTDYANSYVWQLYE